MFDRQQKHIIELQQTPQKRNKSKRFASSKFLALFFMISPARFMIIFIRQWTGPILRRFIIYDLYIKAIVSVKITRTRLVAWLPIGRKLLFSANR
jgi:hypothetical protein